MSLLPLTFYSLHLAMSPKRPLFHRYFSPLAQSRAVARLKKGGFLPSGIS
jgi:hypothetical protein